MHETFLASPTLADGEAIAAWLNELAASSAAEPIVIDWHIIPIAGVYQVIAHIVREEASKDAVQHSPA
jgi:hypothetical protein